MSKEQQELLDEVYKAYISSKSNPLDGKYGDTSVRKLNYTHPYEPILSQEEFIDEIKTDSEFSEKWGLRIEERELTSGERMTMLEQIGRVYVGALKSKCEKYKSGKKILELIKQACDENYIPTKAIKVTYSKTIENYE